MIRGVLAVLALLLLWVSPAVAGDSTLDWRTIETRHFRIHYPRGLEAVAHRSARLCEEARVVVGELYGYWPRVRIDISISDFGDSANGSATALPYPRVSLLAAPPALDGNLADYDDWLRLLIVHEFVHISQLDRTGGLPGWINSVLGRQYAPNQLLPSFILEGGAVWAESATSGRGRIHSAVFRGFLRARALDGSLFDVDSLVHAPQRWPGANVWYMYGGHFFDWLSRRFGAQGAGRLHDAIGDDIVPFGINRAAMEAWGVPLTELVESWQAELTTTARAEAAALAADGLTALHAVTTVGQRHIDLSFAPDGALWNMETGHRRNGLYKRTPAMLSGPPDPEPIDVADLESAGTFDLCRDATGLVFERGDLHQGSYSRFDLYHLDLQTGRERRITHGARVREPGCAPNGRWVAAAQIIQGRTRLVRIELTDGRMQVLYDPGGLNQVAFPRISADGSTVVAVRVSQDDGRDLIAVPADGGPARTVGVTGDAALELQPSFSTDGRWLLYASDRSGVWDIYAHAWPDGPTHRATRVVTGALDPTLSPDGKTLAMQIIGPDGYDIATTPFSPDLPLPPPRDRADPPRPSASDAPLPLPSEPYNGLDRLWPVGWSPGISISDATEEASSLAFNVATSDPLGMHSAVAAVRATPETDNIAVRLDYAYRRFAATLSGTVAHETRARANGAFYGLEYSDFRERVTSVNLGVSLPLGAETRGAGLSLGYAFTRTAPAENPEPAFDPLDFAARFPTGPVSRGSLSLRASYNDIDNRHWDAVSSESGRSASVSLRLRHPMLIGDLTSAEVFWSYHEYLPLWWKHVLGLRLVGAFGRAQSGRRIAYGLGPAPERSWFLDALDGIFYGNTYLRGYPTNTARGDRYVLATAEYRVPVLAVYRGLETLPIFLRRLKAGVFTDWAQASSSPLELKPSRFLRSIGAELISEAYVGWRQPFSVRLGYAKGLDDEGEGQWYFFLGSWF